jgi:hypothetical protein
MNSGNSICGALPTANDEESINPTAPPGPPPQSSYLYAGNKPLVASIGSAGSGAVTSAGTNGGLGRSSYESATVPVIEPATIDTGGPR